ncbi:universal stress protein [Ornithinimicrobium sp. LYQ92]|uniref:universal stress protein n=1 Tax=Serinicoccus sp. LYQ92 TaxID=3378798 RepID=UPI0038546F52
MTMTWTTPATMVVGVDGSEVSMGALRWALGFAWAHGSSVTVLMTWQVPPTIMISPTKTEVDYQRPHKEMFEHVKELVSADAEGLPVAWEFTEARPGPALCHRAEQADLLVVGAHGHGGGEGFHLGSAANYCVHHAPCPVLVHRPHAS